MESADQVVTRVSTLAVRAAFVYKHCPRETTNASIRTVVAIEASHTGVPLFTLIAGSLAGARRRVAALSTKLSSFFELSRHRHS